MEFFVFVSRKYYVGCIILSYVFHRHNFCVPQRFKHEFKCAVLKKVEKHWSKVKVTFHLCALGETDLKLCITDNIK